MWAWDWSCVNARGTPIGLHKSSTQREVITLAVVFAVQKWRHYLLTNHFVIKMDQRSIKYLLEQRLNTPVQQQWLPKLLEFNY